MIKEKIGDRLSDEQIMEIISKINTSEQFEIIVTDNPYEYDKNIKQFEQLGDKNVGPNVETDVLLGDIQPGKVTKYEADFRLILNTDFFVNKPQVAMVKESSNRTTNKNTIQIYIPNERKYQEDVKFSELVEKNKKHNLSEVEETVSDRRREEINVANKQIEKIEQKGENSKSND